MRPQPGADFSAADGSDGVEFSQLQLARALLWSCAAGAALGALYDVFRILRIALGRRMSVWLMLVIFWQDVLYALLAGCAMAVFLFCANEGRVRVFLLAGALSGFLAWFFTVGRLLMALAERIIFAVKWVVGLLLSVTVLPLLRLTRFLARQCAALLSRWTSAAFDRRARRALLRCADNGFR